MCQIHTYNQICTGLAPFAQNLVADFISQKSPWRPSTPLSVVASFHSDPWALRVAGLPLKRVRQPEPGFSASVPFYCLSDFCFREYLPPTDRCVLVSISCYLCKCWVSMVKRDRPCIIPCSYKVHPHKARSEKSILTSIGIPTLFPWISCSDLINSCSIMWTWLISWRIVAVKR